MVYDIGALSYFVVYHMHQLHYHFCVNTKCPKTVIMLYNWQSCFTESFLFDYQRL